MVWSAIAVSPRALGCTGTVFVPNSTGSTHRVPMGWQASWPSETWEKST